MPTGNPDLVQLVRAEIRRRGPVRFDWFMEQALYHPRFGYYSSGQCQIGRRGDYFTNVSVGPLFGRMLAAQFGEMWETLGRPDDFTIVEQGAHDGQFAHDVLTAMHDSFASLRYCVVEPFPILRARQEEKLAGFGDQVRWVESVTDLEPFCGVHFSNELIDALPVRLIARGKSGGWQEKFVTASDNNFYFTTRPVADESLRSHLEKVPAIETTPYETEANLAALDWIQDLAPRLRRGFVLAVDYGYPRAQYYCAERTSGTLQAVARHRPVSSPLEQLGHVDISARVEWTSLAERAEQSGLSVIGFTDQHHFLTGVLTRYTPREDERRALQTLLHPEFLGTRFHYLGLGKDVSATGLSGFQFAADARKALAL